MDIETRRGIMSMTEDLNFPSKWWLWYHDPNNNDWSLESYIKIYALEKLTDYWNIVEEGITEKAWTSGMYFLMRDGYRPIWEVPENQKGGAWSQKIDASQTYPIFKDLIVHCLAEKILKEHNDHIVGVSISPKSGFHIIKIWNKDPSLKDKLVFQSTLRMKTSDLAYKKHNDRH